METFAESLPERFAGQEMGEDALSVLHESLKLQNLKIAIVVFTLPRAVNPVFTGIPPFRSHIRAALELDSDGRRLVGHDSKSLADIYG
jgi:hypothetical protein